MAPYRASRRQMIHLAAGGAAALGAPSLARAQGEWRPSQQMRLIVPFAPGGTTDIVARILAQHLGPRLGQTVVVDNRPGAGGMVGSLAATQAAPDGHTLVVSNVASHGIWPTMAREIRYNAVTDFSHIGLLATTATAVLVNPRYEIQSIADLVRVGKSRPAGVDFATAGFGTSTHLAGMRIGLQGGFKMNPVVYRGSGPALADVMAGTVGLTIDSMPAVVGHIRAGTLKALAVLDPQRNAQIPDVPTLAEQGFPGLVSYSWFGISGPAGMPAAAVQRISTEMRAVFAMPEVRARYRELSAEAPDMTPEQYTAFVRDEVRVWGDVVRATGVRAE
jgi:tripartite-type tricarboxylate transporter receptor subunit TctC